MYYKEEVFFLFISVWTPVLFNMLRFKLSLLLDYQIAPALANQEYLHDGSCSLLTLLSFFKHVLTFLHSKMLILCFLGSSPRISHFSKEPWFLLVNTISVFIATKVSLLLNPFSIQSWEIYLHVYLHTHIWNNINIYWYIFLRLLYPLQFHYNT